MTLNSTTATSTIQVIRQLTSISIFTLQMPIIIGLHADETIVSATYNLLVQYRGDNPGNPSDDSTVFYSPTGANNANASTASRRGLGAG